MEISYLKVKNSTINAFWIKPAELHFPNFEHRKVEGPTYISAPINLDIPQQPPSPPRHHIPPLLPPPLLEPPRDNELTQQDEETTQRDNELTVQCVVP
jgi:hypothetical protein